MNLEQFTHLYWGQSFPGSIGPRPDYRQVIDQAWAKLLSLDIHREHVA